MFYSTAPLRIALLKNSVRCFYLFMIGSLFSAYAEETAQKFNIGKIEFIASHTSVKILRENQPPVTVEILPGGKFWPPVKHDAQGRFFVGDKIVDTNTGKITQVRLRDDNSFLLNSTIAISPKDIKQRFKIRTGTINCTLQLKKLGFGSENKKSASALVQHYNVQFTASDKEILALQTHFDASGNDVATYKVSSINPLNCQVLSQTKLGDPDLLVELGWSKEGGWWIIGSIEQTLLRSRDGKHWQTSPLPEDISSMVSGYMVSDKEIWLAAGMASHTEEDDPMLLRSLDGGKTWASFKQDAPELNTMPPYWMEGIQRGRSVTVPRT